MSTNRWASLGALLLLVGGPLASAQVTSFVGSQHFTDGQLLGTGTYLTAVSGQPAPFDHFIGSDTAADFSTGWTMTYLPPASVGGASLTLGIYDHDSKASANPVSYFGVNGVDLTSLMNATLTSHGGANTEYNVYTVILPGSVYAGLQSGTADFQLTLKGPGSSVLGDTTFNGSGLDFATLYLAIPEPATEAWFGAAAGLALAGVHYRRRSR